MILRSQCRNSKTVKGIWNPRTSCLISCQGYKTEGWIRQHRWRSLIRVWLQFRVRWPIWSIVEKSWQELSNHTHFVGYHAGYGHKVVRKLGWKQLLTNRHTMELNCPFCFLVLRWLCTKNNIRAYFQTWGRCGVVFVTYHSNYA